MYKTTFLLTFIFCCMIFISAGAQEDISDKYQVTFKLKVTEIANPDSLAINWFVEPYVRGKTELHEQLFPQTHDEKGLYEQSILFPDSLIGKTIRYIYTAKENKYDFSRTFVLGKNQVQEKIESWGFVDGLEEKIRPGKMIFPAPGSPEETAIFSAPFTGITTNGKPVENLFSIKKTGVSTTPVKDAVKAFLETLTEEQKGVSIFPIESIEWRRWHNMEGWVEEGVWGRTGVLLEKMSSRQKELVFNILKESLSAEGFQKVKDILTMEAYLATLVPDNKYLGGDQYWFTFFGTPSDTEPYGYQIEGHHLIINYFVLGDQIVMTPTFMGSEPNYVDSGEHEGVRTFEEEEKKGLDFYLSLNKEQKDKARLFDKKDYDFNRSEAFRDNEIIPTKGIPATALSKQQQQALLDLITVYVGNIRPGHAKIKMADVISHLSQTHFTWIQGDKTDGPFYYRIHSPVILIEFDHQTPVFIYDETKPRPGPVKTHVHTVVRTPNGNDYGKNLLKMHLEKDHKHQKK